MPRHFDDWLMGYMEYTSASESPTGFHFWTGVSTIAGALRGKVWRDELTFRWTPNFYIMLVGPPGIAQKSTSMKLGMGLLEKIEGIHFGPSSATWQSLGQTMQKAVEQIDYTDIDGTDKSFSVSSVTLAISEMGTFMKLAQEGFADVLIDMWDGQVSDRPWSHSTVASTKLEIMNPWLNMIACTTPSWLKQNVTEVMIGGGLMSRILPVFGDKKRQYVAYPSQHYRQGEFSAIKQKLIEDLQQIADMRGPFDMTQPAFKWGSEWYANMWASRPAHLSSDRFDSYIARKQVFLHKLAMIRAAATGNSLILTEQHLEWAATLLIDVERQMGRVWQSIGYVKEASNLDTLVRQLLTFKQLTPDQLFGQVHKNIDRKAFLEALEAGLKSQMISARKAKVGNQLVDVLIPGPYAQDKPAEGG